MEPCKPEIFSLGHSICTLDACQHRAETWVQSVANLSGQSVDWHYSGGIANVLYLGDHASVLAAVEALVPTLAEPMERKPGECGSCGNATAHRPGMLLRIFGAHAHGPYREGDALPPGVVAVDTH